LANPFDETLASRPEPAFNIPAIVIAMIGAMLAIHVLREQVLTDRQNGLVLAYFSFIGLRYSAGSGSEWWPLFSSPVTHAFLHGSWAHLAVNAVWFAAFGSPLAARIGAIRFSAFFALTAAPGAFLFLAFNPGSASFLVGASGAVSGMTAAAARFAFRVDRSANSAGFAGRPLSMAQTFSNRTSLMFIAVWLAMNLITAWIMPGLGLGDVNRIAWEAHLGGFLAGLLLLSALDRPDH
jgi:membrane associated rhomboid family serine protease